MERIKRIFEKNKIPLCEVQTEGGNFKLKYLEVELKNQEFITLNKSNDISFEEIPASELFININTPKVLNKVINFSEIEIINQVFPGIDLREFNYQHGAEINGKTIVSLIRKNDLNEVLDYFKEKGKIVAGVSIGLSGLTFALNQINDWTIIQTDTHFVDCTNGLSIQKQKSTVEELYGENKNVSSYYLNLLGTAMTFKFFPEFLSLNNDNLNWHRDEYKYARIYSYLLKTGLAIVLLVLLINFLVFDSYYLENAKLESRLSLISSDKRLYDKTYLEFNEKLDFIKQQNLSENTKASFYFDKIAAGIPKSVNLISFSYNPLLKKPKIGQDIVVENNTMILSGESTNKVEFISWIDNIKHISFIEELDVDSYDKISSSRMAFKLNLKLLDDE